MIDVLPVKIDTPHKIDSPGWGKVMVGARLEKMVEAGWLRSWSRLLNTGMRPGDRWEMTEGMVAHMASNALARELLKSDCDSLLIVDSDADFEPDFIEQLRTHEPGFDFDALQVFHLRRGWPPEAIWFKRDERGILHNCVIFGDITEEVALVGTHCVMIRREVFEKLLGDNSPEKYDWFFYPRHEHMTEDAAFSFDALEAGFRLGATSHVKVNHIGHLAVGWDVYQEFLQTSGQGEQLARFEELSELVGKFTGESQETIVDKMKDGGGNVARAWEKYRPQTVEQMREFYGREDNGYLYDLLNWNCSTFHVQITRRLKSYFGRRALVIGAGLGTEAALLAPNNQVEIFELPGVLRDFCKSRLDGTVSYLDGEDLLTALDKPYDLIVAIDTIEHFHPAEFDLIMDNLAAHLLPGGDLYCHNNFTANEVRAMDFDHSAAFARWAERNHIQQKSEFVWTKEQ